MVCQNCEHPGAIHNDRGCRVTGCECSALEGPPAAPEPPRPRRVCVDVPDGYTLSFTLIPDRQGDD